MLEPDAPVCSETQQSSEVTWSVPSYGYEIQHDASASPDRPCQCAGCVTSAQWQAFYASGLHDVDDEPALPASPVDSTDLATTASEELTPTAQSPARDAGDSQQRALEPERSRRLPVKLRGLGGCYACGDGEPNEARGNILFCDGPKCGTGQTCFLVSLTLMPSTFVCFYRMAPVLSGSASL